MGYTLDEIPNDITRATPASFEPVIDYVVTKVPRWAFEKFPGTADVLGTQMQSVGEVMAIGRTFPESVQKAMRSLEQGRFGLNCDPGEAPGTPLGDDELLARIAVPTPDRLFGVEAALRRGLDRRRGRRGHRHRPLVLRPAAAPGRGAPPAGVGGRSGRPRPPALAAGQAARLLRRPAGLAVGGAPRPRSGRPGSRPA